MRRHNIFFPGREVSSRDAEAIWGFRGLDVLWHAGAVEQSLVGAVHQNPTDFAGIDQSNFVLVALLCRRQSQLLFKASIGNYKFVAENFPTPIAGRQ